MRVGDYIKKKYTSECGWIVGKDWSTLYFIVRFEDGTKEELTYSDLE